MTRTRESGKQAGGGLCFDRNKEKRIQGGDGFLVLSLSLCLFLLVRTQAHCVVDALPFPRDWVRDYVKLPRVIKLRDKISFTTGVVGIGITEALCLQAPQLFWAWYLILMAWLLTIRYVLYTRRKWVWQSEFQEHDCCQY